MARDNVLPGEAGTCACAFIYGVAKPAKRTVCEGNALPDVGA